MQLGRIGSAAWNSERDDVLELSPNSFAKKRERQSRKRPLYKPRPTHQSASSSRGRGRHSRRRRSRSHDRRRRRSRSYSERRSRSRERRKRRKSSYSPRRKGSPKRMYIPPPRRTSPLKTRYSPPRRTSPPPRRTSPPKSRYSPSRRDDSPPAPKLPLGSSRKSKIMSSHLYQPPTWSDFPTSNKLYLFQVIKEGEHILNIPLFQQANFTTFGKDANNEVQVLHPSTSRYHATIQYGKPKKKAPAGMFLYDLKSSHGTTINSIKLQPERFQEVVPGDRVGFGGSKRVYLLVEGSNASSLPFTSQKSDVPRIEQKKVREASDWEKELRETEREVGVNPIQRYHKKMLSKMQNIWDWRDPTFNNDRTSYLSHMKRKKRDYSEAGHRVRLGDTPSPGKTFFH